MSLLLRRMESDSLEYAPGLYERLAVQPQTLDCRTAARGLTYDR